MKYVTMTNTNFSKMELTEGFIDKLLDYMDNGVQLNGLDKTSVKIVEVFSMNPHLRMLLSFPPPPPCNFSFCFAAEKTIKQLKENRYMAPRIDLTGDSSMPPTPGI